MTSMKEIAEKAKVSQATVSRVLSGHPSVKPATKQEVLYWVKKLNYQPNIAARSLAGSKTNLIGVVFPEISNPFFSEILGSLEECASYEGYQLLICCTHKNIEREKSILNELKSRNVDGIITVPVSSEKSEPIYKSLNIPVVVITKKMNGFNSISISHYNGGYKIARHLISLGYQNIGYVGPVKTSTSSIKYKGFEDCLIEYGLSLCDIIETPVVSTVESLATYQSIKDYIANNKLKSNALFASDDSIACDAIRALSEYGYSIPNDIAIIGFDNSLLAKKMYPSISSLSQPLYEMGQKALSVLLSIINKEFNDICNFELDTRVVSRNSTVYSLETKY